MLCFLEILFWTFLPTQKKNVHSKFQVDSKWKEGGVHATQFVSHWGLEYPISNILMPP